MNNNRELDNLNLESLVVARLVLSRVSTSMKRHEFDDCILSASKYRIIIEQPSYKILETTSDFKIILKEDHLKDKIVGKDVTFEETEYSEGIIKPCEISINDTGNSKWLYSCFHSAELTSGVPVIIRCFDDPSDLKKCYSSAVRDPLKLESIKKVSTKIPDFIVDEQYKIGEIATISMGNDSNITRIFPFEMFLQTEIQEFVGTNLLAFIEPEDHTVVLQSLCECVDKGFSNSIVRWTRNGTVKWIQIQCTSKQEDSIVIATILELKDNNVAATLFSKASSAWGYFSMSANSLYKTTSKRLSNTNAATIKSISNTANGFMALPVLEKSDFPEPKM